MNPTAEPIEAPLPTGPLSNYLIVYAYPNGQVEFHCSTPDPVLNFKMLAIMADAMSNAFKQMADAAQEQDQPLIHRVNHHG